MKKHGKLIVIESGSDASGKATQTQLLFDRLKSEGFKVHKIEFPDYQSESSTLVKMYLRGEFGKNALEVDPYIASTFFTIDRYCSYKTKWEDLYKEESNIILCDRYTYSNIINQASKLPIEKREEYCKWLLNLEFDIYKIPQPDLVIFLNMPVEKSISLIQNRKNKITNSDEKDIHEKDTKYLTVTYDNALNMAKKYNWNIIDCVKNDTIRTAEDIHEEIYLKVKNQIL